MKNRVGFITYRMNPAWHKECWQRAVEIKPSVNDGHDETLELMNELIKAGRFAGA